MDRISRLNPIAQASPNFGLATRTVETRVCRPAGGCIGQLSGAGVVHADVHRRHGARLDHRRLVGARDAVEEPRIAERAVKLELAVEQPMTTRVHAGLEDAMFLGGKAAEARLKGERLRVGVVCRMTGGRLARVPRILGGPGRRSLGSRHGRVKRPCVEEGCQFAVGNPTHARFVRCRRMMRGSFHGGF